METPVPFFLMKVDESRDGVIMSWRDFDID